MIVAPGAYDCITARTIAQAGFSAVYMTGAGTAATLGFPDYGLVTMSEMADNAGRIAASVDVPVIASGGVGSLGDLVDGITIGGADAVLAASIFHYGEFTVGQAKSAMAAAGIEIRR